MQSLKSANFQIKIVAQFLQLMTMLFAFMVLGAIIGPAIDSQAGSPLSTQNFILLMLTMMFGYSGTRLQKYEKLAFWLGGLSSLAVGLFLMFNIITGRGSIAVQLVCAVLFVGACATIFLNRHLLITKINS